MGDEEEHRQFSSKRTTKSRSLYNLHREKTPCSKRKPFMLVMRRRSAFIGQVTRIRFQQTKLLLDVCMYIYICIYSSFGILHRKWYYTVITFGEWPYKLRLYYINAD